MSFRTAVAGDGIVVHSISRVLNGNTPTAGSGYDFGYHFRFNFTINNLSHSLLEFKLADWTRTDNNNSMAVANNAKVAVSATGVNNHTQATTTLTSTDYVYLGDVYTMDADPTLGGRQLYLDLFYQIPVGAQGIYSTSYGIIASDND
jgi:hypothetical protein